MIIQELYASFLLKNLKIMKKLSFLLVLSLVVLVFGCKNNEESPAPEPEVPTNPNSPDGNSLILNQVSFEGEKNVFLSMIPKSNGNFYYSREDGTSYYIGEMTKSASNIWGKKD